MAGAAEVRALEDSCPWTSDDHRTDLRLLADGGAATARQFAADVRVLARLAGRVPRCAFDETGSTPWTSFRREVAVARKISDRAAGQLIRCASHLTTALPRSLALLEAGVLTVPRVMAIVTELEPVSAELASQVDAELADALALLPTWRIRDEVRKALLRLDPDVTAQRVAAKNADRGVSLHPDVDDQAVVSLVGPAVPLTRWYATLDARARALKAAGDPRPLDALRFDLATSTYPCDTHSPADPTSQSEAAGPQVAAYPPPAATAHPSAPAASAGAAEGRDDQGRQDEAHDTAAEAGSRPSFVEPAPADCRTSRPVQAHIVVPVETALGLSNEPAWLDGYGWISAPTSRQLLLDAELRRVCVKAGTGELVDLAARDVRPPPTPTGLRDSLLTMVLGDLELSDIGWREEPQHDPTGRLHEYVTLRDRFCDGPTSARVPARRADLDHDTPWPTGPTAAWNLAARGRRTHQHKHHGWTPLRTATSTLWLSPSGQLVEVPRHTSRPPGVDEDPYLPPQLPDPDELHLLDALQLTPPSDEAPVLPRYTDRTTWTMLPADEPVPF